MTKLIASLPKGEANGLNALARELIDDPTQVHVRRIEPIQTDKALVSKIMRRALESRTGKTVLPFDLEEDMRAAFEGIDPHTGEILE